MSRLDLPLTTRASTSRSLAAGCVLGAPFYQLLVVAPADATWHQHGVFSPPPGAETLVATDDGASVLYIDRVSTPGTLLVTSLDLVYHYGSYFMPATERFLGGFLPWVTGQLP